MMQAVARKQDLDYPLTPEWKARVREELDRRGRGAFTRLAKEIGIPTAKLANILGTDQQTSTLVARINKELGWAAPLPPSTSRDAGELQHIYQRLDASQRKLILDAADLVDHDEDAAHALEALVSVLRKKSPANG